MGKEASGVWGQLSDGESEGSDTEEGGLQELIHGVLEDGVNWVN